MTVFKRQERFAPRFSYWMLLTIMGIVFILSLSIYRISNRNKIGIFLFPNRYNVLAAELRRFPKTETREEIVKHAVSALLSGPNRISSYPFFPEGTHILGSVLSKKTLYLDLSAELSTEPFPRNYTYIKTIALLEKNLYLNFRFLNEIVITIEGQEPGQPYFERYLLIEND